MTKKLKIKINGEAYNAEEGQTIKEVAEKNGVFIPTLCSHPDFPAEGNCRVCLVEVKGMKRPVTSCSTPVRDKMEVTTDTERVSKSRNINLALLYAEHVEKCPTCVWRYECKLLEYAKKYKIDINGFEDRKKNRKTYKFANAVELDASQCIDCRNCVDACSKMQNINYLEIKGRSINQEIKPTSDKEKQCILCGQCAAHCPVSAAQEQYHYHLVEKALKDKNKVLVAQFAPSVRVAIGEDFGLPYGKVMTEHISAGLKALGFDYVFDINFAADVTTLVEAEELLERVAKGGKMPMFTSCCPGWVNYVEMYHPELIPHLTTSRSPEIHGGGIIKTYWAQKMGINPKDILVVSVMPCTAKKYESARPEMKINGLLPVDIVLTTREFSFLLKKNKLDLSKIKKTKTDNPLGEFSGGAAIFGGTGGVMESALRTAQYMACGMKEKGKICRTKIDFKEVRGMDRVKKAVVDVAGTKVRVAVVNGIAGAESVIKDLKSFDYIEVMACPGGCIGGGGQPIPTTDEIRKKRLEALYVLDKKCKLRKSYENKQAVEAVEWLKSERGLAHKVLHTSYINRIKKSKKTPIKLLNKK